MYHNLTSIVLLLLMIVSKFPLALRCCSSLGHMFCLIHPRWVSLVSQIALDTRRRMRRVGAHAVKFSSNGMMSWWRSTHTRICISSQYQDCASRNTGYIPISGYWRAKGPGIGIESRLPGIPNVRVLFERLSFARSISDRMLAMNILINYLRLPE